jgi:hypothetical protein
MPTVLQSKGFRLFFFRNDRTGSPHIHIESEGNYALFQLKPIELEKSVGYNVKEIGEIKNVITANYKLISEKWDGYFSPEN